MAQNLNLRRVRGDNTYMTLVIKDSNDAVINITGYDIRFTLRDLETIAGITNVTTDNDAILTKTATLTDPTNGVAQFQYVVADFDIDPKRYSYDIQIKASGVVTTLVYGYIDIIADTTRWR